VKTIAISRDLREHFLAKKGKYFTYPAQVYVESDNPSIQGCYWVYDTMNKRWKNRIDLFFMSRKDNQGGTARISNKLDLCK
jgi:3D (Asp-Asp-Asp) domain-containing protein